MSYKMSHKQDTLKNTEISIMQTQSQITPKTPQMSLYERNMHELDHKTQDELKTLEIAKKRKNPPDFYSSDRCGLVNDCKNWQGST